MATTAREQCYCLDLVAEVLYDNREGRIELDKINRDRLERVVDTLDK